LDEKQTSKVIKSKIDIEFMEKVFKEEFEKPITHFVENSNFITKVFLIALLFQFIKKNNKYIDIN